jgi:hypothetical protein
MAIIFYFFFPVFWFWKFAKKFPIFFFNFTLWKNLIVFKKKNIVQKFAQKKNLDDGIVSMT